MLLLRIAEYINSHIAYDYGLYISNPFKVITKPNFKVSIVGLEEQIDIEELHILVPHASEIKLTSENIEVYFTWPKRQFEDKTIKE